MGAAEQAIRAGRKRPVADEELRRRHEPGDEVAKRASMGERCRAGLCCAHRVPERDLTEEEVTLLRRTLKNLHTSLLREDERATASSLIARIAQVFLQPIDDAHLARARQAYRRGVDACARLEAGEITPEDAVREIQEHPL